MTTLSRRQALLLLAGLSGVSLLPQSARFTLASARPNALARLTGGLDTEAAAQLGRMYLEQHADSADFERRLEALLQEGESSRDLQSFLSSKVREDFDDGRVVDLEDWQISETEARIFGAIALTG